MKAKALAALLLLCGALCAQAVTVANYSAWPFDGWKRTTVDVRPPHDASAAIDIVAENGDVAQGVRYVTGRQVGSVWCLDVQVSLAPGQAVQFELQDMPAGKFARPPLAADQFGVPSLGGAPLQVVSIAPDGAGWLVHCRGRVGPMLVGLLWANVIPTQPWSSAEIVVCASNPTVPDMVGTVPDGFALRVPGADVLVAGANGPGPLLPSGTQIGDGQARSWPVTIVWRDRLTKDAWASAGAASSLGVCAAGVSRLLPDGNPTFPDSFSPATWTRQHFAGAIARLHGWDAGPLGVAANSGQTGSQEDQLFVGGEALRPGGVGAETVTYLVALGMSRRPCHHLEADGAQLDPARHPNLVLWASRPHWHTGVSPDQLGKPRGITMQDTHGWMGPDREHWLCNRLAAGARLTGSPALQWQLGQQARTFLLQETVDPKLSTSSPDAARSVGYAGILVAHLWENLEDRQLAGAVVKRWHERVLRIYVPILGAKVADIWDVREDQRIIVETGRRLNWMPDQQSLGAYGLDLACALVGPKEGRALAHRAARAVLDRAWSQQGDAWLFWERVGWDGDATMQLVERDGAHRTGWFEKTWALPALAVVLRHEPKDERARAVWAQHAAGGGSWVAPGVR